MATPDAHMESEEDEYVMLDLDSIGEYDETIGTCIVLSEDGELKHRKELQNLYEKLYLLTDACFADAPPVIHEETGPSETNLFAGKSIIDSNQVLKKQIKPVCQLQKILRFKLLSEEAQTDIVQDSTIEPRTIKRS
ncbi:hypothetical protein Ccrd_019490 [Cynara cardunculus var. scolymus]|uniref:Uncharacterized protein n=1 Tax=Cynara cardunculus var. scolymus TaxID=59895 RepID=A0A103Y486_CYNCS|nr:hypothetical protein Ccrd_019490 [Cynara cardunculus var. scolymus]